MRKLIRFLRRKDAGQAGMTFKILFLLLTAHCSLFTANAKFIDVDTTHPYFYGIDFLQQEDILRGYQKGDIKYFRPMQQINRVEALKILLLAAQIDLLESHDHLDFPDVSLQQWYTPFVSTAVDLEVINGYPDGTFHPEAKITMAEFLKMLVLTFDIPHEEQAENEKWFTPYLNTARQLHLITAPENPDHIVNRGEASEMIFRAINVVINDFRPYVFSGSGQASYYNEGFAGKVTASGEIYDPFDLTAAHRILPFGTQVRVINDDNGKSVVVRINDRGPYHSNRVLDLSQRAFETLDQISRGVINVKFEILSDPTQDDDPKIPEFIRPVLKEEENRQPLTPDFIQEKIAKNRASLLGETIQEKALEEKEEPGPPTAVRQIESDKNIFDETVILLPRDFYPGVTLRREIPIKIPLGTVIKFAGYTNEVRENITVFIHDPRTETQDKFESSVSGKNFSFPIAFLREGKFQMGVVFDDQKRSRVAEIEVIDIFDSRKLGANTRDYNDDTEYTIEVATLPEKEKAQFSWVLPPEHIGRLEFTQGPNLRKSLYIEDGISSFEVPYQFFDTFKANERLAVDLYVAPSENRQLQNQSKDWIQVAFRNFRLLPGFPDSQEDVLQIPGFRRFHQTKATLPLNIKLRDSRIELRDVAYLTKPDGLVYEIPLEAQSADLYRAEVTPETFGTYIFEVMTREGEVLFNRALYFYNEWVLPVAPWSHLPVRSQNISSLRFWINTLRKDHGRGALNESLELNRLAQSYAQRMADEGFVGHIDPQGEGFQDRIKAAGIPGTEFGENVSFGTTLQLALDGLADSGSHRKNILEQKWTKVGIGVAQNDLGEYFVVQIFGK